MSAQLQIFGTAKCKTTRKAQRFFKERGKKFQFVDLKIKEMSKGELESVAKAVGGIEALVNEKSPLYESLHLGYVQKDLYAVLQEHPLLTQSPVVRLGRDAAVGDRPDRWKEIAANL